MTCELPDILVISAKGAHTNLLCRFRCCNGSTVAHCAAFLQVITNQDPARFMMRLHLLESQR